MYLTMKSQISPGNSLSTELKYTWAKGRLVPLICLVFLLTQQVFSENTVEQEGDHCFPIISFSFFNESAMETKGPPHLYNISSSSVVESDRERQIFFPYQFVLMTCSVPYPIEWVSGAEVPKHYFFSYVLDEEMRLSSGLNDSDQNYAVRLHIGNETLSRDNLTQVTVACRPVERAMAKCGVTYVTIRKHGMIGKNMSLAKSRTVTNLSASFTFERTNYDSTGEKEKLNCFTELSHIMDSSEGSESMQCLAFGPDEPVPHNLTFSNALHFNASEVKAPQGQLLCKTKALHSESKYVPEKVYAFPYFLSLPKFCNDEDRKLPRLYVIKEYSERKNEMSRCEGVEEKDFLSLCVTNAVENSGGRFYIGDNITITCITSIYYFARGIRIISALKKGQSSAIFPSDEHHERELSNGIGGYRNLTINLKIDSNSSGPTGIECQAPVRKSRRWVTKTSTLDIKVPLPITFHETPDTMVSLSSEHFLVCNASGDPLPVLHWSRLNNEAIPKNKTIEVSPNSSWIISKLYFNLHPNETDRNPNTTPIGNYYGRYICTARNRFQSMEKVFVFSEKDSLEGREISGGKSSLFWIGVSGTIFIFGLIIAYLTWRLKMQTKNMRIMTKSEIDEFLFGKPELLLDGEYEEINSYAAYLPFDKDRFEIEREQFEFDQCDILGSGAYGSVYKGMIKISSCGNCYPVAIKTVNVSSDKMYFTALLSEVKIMCFVGTHDNIVKLIGACTKYLDQRQLFVITEYCANGDLLSYIRKHKQTFQNNTYLSPRPRHETNINANNSSTKILKLSEGLKGSTQDGYCRLSDAKLFLTPHLLLLWALQISQGMVFLASKRVIHADLALRNVLLSEDLKPKIGDFGLSKRIQNYANYVRTKDELVPWRWLAIESLQFMKFSVQSDIWAFAVLLFELFSLGQVPFASHNFTEHFIVSLCQGERLAKPCYADEKMYSLMLDCWKHRPEDRPSFQNIESKLREWVSESESKLMTPLTSFSTHINSQEMELEPCTESMSHGSGESGNMQKEFNSDGKKNLELTANPISTSSSCANFSRANQSTESIEAGTHWNDPDSSSAIENGEYMNNIDTPMQVSAARPYVDWTSIN